MPPINPEQLLNALGPLLTNTGGIKGAQEATKIIGLMKVAKKLVNKCIYLNILRVTESQEALEKFISLGGWDTLNLWLDTARNNDNTPLVGELLEVYINLPVTVVLLKQNSAAKTIKQLSKSENERIKTLSGQLVERWTQTIRSQSKEEMDADDKKKKKKHKEKEKDKKDSKEKENKKEENSTESTSSSSDKSKHRDRDRDSSKKTQSSRDKDRRDRDSKDKDKDRHKDKDRSSRHDKSKSSSENKDQKDPSSNNNKDSSSSTKKPLSTEESSNPLQSSSLLSSSTANAAGKESLDENPRRFKTVRKVGDKFRSTGLFDDEDDEAEEKEAAEEIKKKKANLEKAALPAGLKRANTEKQEEMSEKKPRLHLTMPPINPVSLEGTGVNASTTTPPEVTHGRIKLIAPKKAPSHEIHESNVFMDALQSSTYAHGSIKRKKKLPGASPTTPPTSVLRSSSAISPPQVTSPTSTTAPESAGGSAMSPPLLSPTSAMANKLPSVPSFYRDTLEDFPDPGAEKKEEEKSLDGEGENDEDGPPQLDMMETDQGEAGGKKGEEDLSTENREEQKDADDTSMQQAPGSGVENDRIHQEDMEMEDDSGTSSESRPNRSRKRVSWATEARLEEVFFFELDETERENVNRPKNFNEMRRDEMVLDRRAMDAARRVINDNMVEVLPWRVPRPIDNAIIAVELGCNSVERDIQMERERSVLCALFFNKVPDTPIEPEPDIPGEQADTKDIPLEDENGSCTVYEHTYNLNDPSSLPYDPEFDLPLQNQGPGGPQQFNNMNMGGGMNRPMNGGAGGGGGSSGNGGAFMNNNVSNMPPALSHLLNTLQQQARDNRDPVLANMQGMLANVVQSCNPQDSNLLMERILNVVEPFRHQIPGLNGLINSVMNVGGSGAMDNSGNPRGYMNHQGGPNRGMAGGGGGGGSGGPRHGLLGPHPPGFSMGGNQRPPGIGGMMGGNTGGGGMNNQNYYQGSNMDNNMRMGGGGGERGGERGERGDRGDRGERRGGWREGKGGGGGGGRGGGGRRPFGKRGRGRSQICQHFINKGCKYGDSCSFIHPTGGGYD